MFLSISVLSQITYSKIYNPMEYATIGIETFQVENDGYSFINVSIDSSSGYYHNRVILKTNLIGVEIDTLTIEIENKNLYGYSGVMSINDTFIFSGSIAYDNHLASYLIFTDSNFNKTNQIIYGDTIGSTYTFQSIDDACILSNNKDMMFCGEEFDTNTTDNTNISLLKTDSLGNKIWKKNFGYKISNRGWYIESTLDGGAIIGGNSFNGASLEGQVRSYDATVLKVDSAGNEQWYKLWGNPHLNDDWAQVQNSGDGKFIVGTAYAEWDTIMNDYTDKSHRTINIIKLDILGNELWNKKYLSAERTRQLSRLLVLPNNNIVAIGNYIKLDYVNLPHQYTRAWILMLDSSGDSLWYKEYTHQISDGVENKLRDIKPTSDGGYICCGEFSDGLNGIPQSLWVLKLDSTGWYYGMGLNKPTQKLINLNIYPNPTTDNISIDLNDFSKYKQLNIHITSSELKELDIINIGNGESIKNINLKNYPSGVYFIRLQNGTEILGVEKVIKI